MLRIGNRIRESKSGLTGKALDTFKIEGRGVLVAVRLDKPDPILGAIITAWDWELEVLGAGAEKGVSE